MVRCLGISREVENSPRREEDDALILRGVLRELERHRVEIKAVSALDSDRLDLEPWDLILPMCEAYPRLLRLKRAEAEGTLVLNSPESVLSCYRTRMLEKFGRTGGISFPETDLRAAAGSERLEPPSFAAPRGFWIKRGDVHNTAHGRDVVYARNIEEAERVRSEFARREIPNFLMQRHVDGDLLKFYGVGPGQWFTWFYHDTDTARQLPFDLETLAAQAEKSAAALALDFFGGDAIVSDDGRVYIIDLNAWPSFARVRDEAAVQIARRVLARAQYSLSPRRRA